jgi:Holliday junction resolvase RusA-like endonuclease
MPNKYVKWKKDFGLRAIYGWGASSKITKPFGIAIAIVTKSGKMRSDLDNCAGSILDSLQDAKLIGNDRDCRQLSITLRKGVVPVIAVTITECAP